MTELLPITVVVPVRNEEKNLPRCLSALAGKFVDIIVVDSHSTDKTCEIAREFGVKVLQFEWNGTYPKKRNWVLLNYKFATDWVLFLDADETVTEPFLAEVAEAVRGGAAKAYWLNYTNIFLGKKLRFGLPQRKIALLKVGAGLYERIDEDRWSALDMEVHEHPVIDGFVGQIRTPIRHEDYRGILKFIDRHRNYAAWEARRLIELRKAPSHGRLTSRQEFKYKYLDKWWYPYFYFLYVFFVRLGFLDGAAGFYYATYKMWYFITIGLLIYEYRKENSVQTKQRVRNSAAGAEDRAAGIEHGENFRSEAPKR